MVYYRLLQNIASYFINMLLICQGLFLLDIDLSKVGCMDIFTILLLFGIFLTSVLLLWGEGLMRRASTVCLAVGLLGLAFWLRYLCLPYETLDYQDFLARWVQYFRQNGGFAGLSRSVGNYNVPYLYFLALFSYSGIDDLQLIKLLSIFFDVLMAWGCMRLTGLFTPSCGKRLFAFLGVLLLPTVILNGALWGQCDSIYVAFGVWAVYEALSDRPGLSVVFAALSFSFKLQAVFFLPVYLALVLTRRMKWWQLVFFPLTYLLLVLPAVAVGRPLLDTLTLYIDQAGTVGSGLNYNSPSVFALLRNPADTALWSKLGIASAFFFCCLGIYWLCKAGRRLNNEALLGAFLLFLIVVPLLLPHMHERYFYGADVLSLVLCAVSPRYFPVPVLCSFASLLGYHAYLLKRYLLPMRYGTAALLAVLALVILFICKRLYGRRGRRA
jgi:Gpi18-like mannosyltransferase